MTIKFNLKTYKDKTRIYTAVPKAPRISRLWVWDEVAKEYQVPVQGNIYYAAKYGRGADGTRNRIYGSFATLEEARIWQLAEVAEPKVISKMPEQEPEMAKSDRGPLFWEILNEWKRRRFPHIAYSTQVQYDKMLRLHFTSLLDLSLREFTPQHIDRWLDELRDGVASSKKKLTRLSFDHELSLLSTVLKYYQNYHDDRAFQFPIKKRHQEAIHLNRSKTNMPKDLSEMEFLKFREELGKCRNGEMLKVLATVQYFQALRISEAAGLYWEDLHFDETTPWNSRIKIVRSVCYPHRGNEEAFIKGGFKNAVSNNGVKEQPMFPEVHESLKSFYREEASGLVFSIDGKPIPYRVIQCHYDRSFKRAGLPYRGTHVMRHGGCRRVFNDVGELPIAQQLLGNSDMKTTLIYAKRQASALTKVVHGYWEKRTLLLATACTGKVESSK